MKINVERLIWTVQESFDAEADYILESRKKPQWKRTPEEDARVFYHERARYYSNNSVRDLCEILDIDRDKLETIARLAKKWEKAHKWEISFPAQRNADKILSYLHKDEDKPWNDSHINYIHWKINTGAYLKDYEWSLKRNRKAV